MKKNMQKRLALITLTFIFAVMICGVVSAADISNNSSGTDILGENSTTDSSFSNSLNASNENSSTVTSTNSNQSINSTQAKLPDPQIWRNGVPVARGGHPAGYQFDTIAHAIADAQNGDTIMLEDGVTFNENINVNKDLTFAVFNNGRATINGNDNGRVVRITNNRVVTFIGITFIGGYVPLGNGAGIYNDGSGRLTLTNCTFINNNALFGGAVYSSGPLTMTGCDLRGNTANGGMGGAVFAADRNSVLNYNRIVGNTQTQVWKTGLNNIDARYNWWGSNSGPTNSIVSWNGDVHNANYSPWTTLSISANPGIIYNGEQSTVTAQFSYNVPNGIRVDFGFQGAPLGTLNTNPVYTSNGQATTTFTANTAGTSHVMATVDSQTVGPANIVINPCGHVTITKTANTTNPNYYNLVTFTITATNTGPNDVTGLQITDLLPAGLNFVSADTHGFGTYTSGTGIWNIDNLNNLGVATLTLVANVTATGSITNWANVTAQTTYDRFPFENASTILNVPAAASIDIEKEFRDVDNWSAGPISSANYMDHIWAVIKAHNNGPDTATNVLIQDNLPAGFTPNSNNWISYDAGNTWNWAGSLYSGGVWTIDSIANGAEYWLAIEGQITQTGTIINTANQTNQDQYAWNGTDSATATLSVPTAAYIDIYKEFRDSPWGNVINTAYYKDKIYAMVQVLNEGPDSTSLSVLDLLTGINWTGNYYVLSGSVNPSDPNNWVLNDSVNTFNGSYWNIPYFSSAIGGNVKWLAIEGIINQTGTVSNYAETDDQSAYPYNGYDSATAILTVNAAPTSVVVDAVHNFAGQNVNLVAHVTDYYGNSINEGQVRFTVNGVVAGTADVVDGVATFNWQVPSDWNAGTYSIVADFLGTGNYTTSSNTGNLTVDKTPTSVVVDAVHNFAGQNVNMVAHVTDYYGNLVNEGQVRFTVNGVVAGIASVVNGVATLNWQVPSTWNAGTYNIVADFLGTGNYDVSTGTGTLTVDKTPTNLSVKDIKGNKGETVNLKAALTDYYGNSVEGKIIHFKVNGTTVGSAITGADGVAILPYYIGLVGGIYEICAEFTEDAEYLSSTGKGVLKVPQSNIYVLTTVSKNNPTVGEIIKITFKLGNKGPDTAEDVIFTYVMPEGLELVDINGDGDYSYDQSTRTIVWDLGDVPVGDPWLYVKVKVLHTGTFDIDPEVTTITYDPDLANNVQFASINAVKQKVKAASKTVPMQPTGLPIAGLVLAVLAVFSGLVMPKRKN